MATITLTMAGEGLRSIEIDNGTKTRVVLEQEGITLQQRPVLVRDGEGVREVDLDEPLQDRDHLVTGEKHDNG